MTMEAGIRCPVLAPHARYRWDKVRNEHQLLFPEGMIVLNEPGKAIVELCDGRSLDEMVTALKEKFPGAEPEDDVREFLGRLAERGLVNDAAAD